MPSFARILVVALLALFAAGLVVNATSTATMAVKMALADIDHRDMADCTGCDAGGNGYQGGLACDLACTAPFVADLGTESTLSAPAAVSTVTSTGDYDFVGRTGAPEPYPPRTLI